jgi:hypothetical protein
MSQGQSWEGDTPFILPGIDQPPTVPADAAEIGDEMEVIGVTCNGRHRAYLISALSAVRSHVVNDVLGDQALTVTFCNRTDHSRCVGGDGAVPLDLSLGGWRGGKMLLKVGDSFFSHDDEQLPYSDVPFERTTWKAWREAHPETDVYMAPPEPGQG